MEHDVIKKFNHMGRRCVVVKITFGDKSSEYIQAMKTYHTGYVELKPEDKYHELNIQSEEITFRGILSHVASGRVIGFDTAHIWNNMHPKTKKMGYAIKTCKEIAEELERKQLRPIDTKYQGGKR